LQRDPFGYSSVSKLLHDSEQLQHIARLIGRFAYVSSESSVKTTPSPTTTPSRWKEVARSVRQLGSHYSELASAWTSLAKAEGFSLFDEAMRMHHITSRFRSAMASEIIHNYTKSAHSGASLVLPSSTSVDGVAATFGRSLFFGHAPALPLDKPLFGAWSSPERELDAALLGHFQAEEALDDVSSPRDAAQTLSPADGDNNDSGGFDRSSGSRGGSNSNRRGSNRSSSSSRRRNSNRRNGPLLSEGLVVVDQVFSPRALVALRRLCDESTAFYDQKAGYYGAYLGDGFSSGLLLQAILRLSSISLSTSLTFSHSVYFFQINSLNLGRIHC